jgi:formimidoylglutamate deiminase
MKTIYAAEALLPAGWQRDVLLDIDDAGTIKAVRNGRQNSAEDAGGPVLPGMANVHSHAFQRAMAGLAERMGSPEDSFWTWREVMYGFVKTLGPAEVEAIAAQLYVENLKNGYTAVGEFHYLHNAPDGRPYADRNEMALGIVRAARATGIALTLLPALYAWGDFGDTPLLPAQKRFAARPDDVLRMLASLKSAAPEVRLGVAPHSLRAVNPAMLKDLLAGLDAIDDTAPIHIHVSEQVKEVNDCLAWSDLRPVQWLLENMPVGPRWCLVHATHVASAETERLAASKATVGLCPTTEANLGDGIFPFFRYREKNGHYAIGGDSHMSQSPVEELRWIEYGQRLALRRRNIAASEASPSVGGNLWREAARGGAQALGRGKGAIVAGGRADLVVLDREHLNLADRHGEAISDAFVFCGDERLVRHVMVGGAWQVRDGHHPAETIIAERFRKVQKGLLA